MRNDKPIPNLFMVGAPKCGTASMNEYLRRHPQIFFPFEENNPARTKEPNYFCPELEIGEAYSVNGESEYLAVYRGSARAKWRGDALTKYLFSEQRRRGSGSSVPKRAS